MLSIHAVTRRGNIEWLIGTLNTTFLLISEKNVCACDPVNTPARST